MAHGCYIYHIVLTIGPQKSFRKYEFSQSSAGRHTTSLGKVEVLRPQRDPPLETAACVISYA